MDYTYRQTMWTIWNISCDQMFVVITKSPSKVEEDIVEGLYHKISVQCARKNTYAFRMVVM